MPPVGCRTKLDQNVHFGWNPHVVQKVMLNIGCDHSTRSLPSQQGAARRRTVDDDAMMEVWLLHLSAITLSLLQNCTAMK
jgi:hypothetical protein